MRWLGKCATTVGSPIATCNDGAIRLPFTAAESRGSRRMYPIQCKRHKEHCEECTMCRNFDDAVKVTLAGYKLPPSSHPTVIGPQVKEWMSSLFPLVKS
jgi:hypothetical protein